MHEFLRLLRHLAGHVGKALRALGIELQIDLVAAHFIHGRVGAADRLAGHFPRALHEEFADHRLAVAAFLLVGLDLVTERDVAGRGGLWRGQGIDEAEVEPRGLLHRIEHVGIVAGVYPGQLHLDAVRSDRTHDGHGHAETVDTVADDFDRFDQLFRTLDFIHIAKRRLVHFEGEGHAALEIETELKPALRLREQMLEQEVVALGDVAHGALQRNVREIFLREVDLPLVGDVAQGDKNRGGLLVVEACLRIGQQGLELGFGGTGFGDDVVGKIPILERCERECRPHHDGKAQHELPQVAFKHGVLLV